MTLATAAWGFDGKTYSGEDMRRLVQGLALAGMAQGSGITQGFKVSAQASPNNTVSVAAGNAVIASTAAGTGGEYHVWNDAALTSPAFAPTSTNGRIDRLILRVTAGVPALEIVQGIASGTPAVPAITGDNFIELAQITFGASTSNVITAMIAERRVFVGRWALPWGIIPSTGEAQITADSGASGGSFTVPGLLVSVPASYPANRKLRLHAHVYALNNAGTGNQAILIATSPGLVEIGQTILGINIAGAFCAGGECTATTVSPGGAQSWVMRTSTASSAVGVSATALHPATLRVEDIGPATATPD